MSKDIKGFFQRTDGMDADAALKAERTDALGAGQPETYATIIRAQDIIPNFVAERLVKVMNGEKKKFVGLMNQQGNGLELTLQRWRKLEEILLIDAFLTQGKVQHESPYEIPEERLKGLKDQAVGSFFSALGEAGAKRFKATDFSDKPFEDFRGDPKSEKKNRQSNERNHEIITENILRILMTLPLEESKEFYNEITGIINSERFDNVDRGAKLITVVENKLPEVFPVFAALRDNEALRVAAQQGKDISPALTELQEAVASARFLQTIAEQQERKAARKAEKAEAPLHRPGLQGEEQEVDPDLAALNALVLSLGEEIEELVSETKKAKDLVEIAPKEPGQPEAKVENSEEAEALLRRLKELQGKEAVEVNLDDVLSGKIAPEASGQVQENQELRTQEGEVSNERRGIKRQRSSRLESLKQFFKKGKTAEDTVAPGIDEEAHSDKKGGILRKISSKFTRSSKTEVEVAVSESKAVEVDTSSSDTDDDRAMKLEGSRPEMEEKPGKRQRFTNFVREHTPHRGGWER